MKKMFFLAAYFIFVYCNISTGQNVGIGTPNPQNKLHVAGGFRLDTLTSVNGAGILKHDATGVVHGIKFSGNIADVLRGDGSFGAAGAGSAGWVLTGNNGTNPANNFLGTTDNQPLLFRANNTRHGYIGRNIFFGSNAGLLNTGIGNIGIGSGSLEKNVSGIGIVSVGDSALHNNTAASNTAIGYKTLYANTTGTRNTAVGNEALARNVDGTDNTSLGYNALLQNMGGTIAEIPVGNKNTAVGSEALTTNIQGIENSAFGANALKFNRGNYNSAFGSNAMLLNQTGASNAAFGIISLFSNTTGYENAAFGISSLYNNTIGFHNSALGANSLSGNITGEGNTAMGYSALSSTQTAAYNTAIGYKSLLSNRANLNTGVGYRSLEKNVFGSTNTAVGEEALFNNTSGSDNVAIGSQALFDNTTGNFNTAIGYNAQVSQSNLSNSTAIGANAEVGASNALVLGGIGVNAVKVGIGVIQPLATLHVRGSAKIFAFSNTHIGEFWNGTSSSNGFEVTSIGSDAYVGIQRGSGAGLHVSKPSGTTGPLVAFFRNAAVVGAISTDGVNTSYGTTSDFRLKENRRPAHNSLQTIMQIKTENYNYISDNNKTTYTGFIAQELFKIYPQAVEPGGDDPKTKPWMIDYSKLTPLLVKAVQEQQTIIERQQSLIDELLKRVQVLEKL